MGLLYHPPRRKQSKQAQIIAAVVSTVAATSGVLASIIAPKKSGAHGGTASINTVIVIAMVVALVVVMLTVGRNLTLGAAESAADDDEAASQANDDADDRRPFVLLAAVIAIVAMIVVALVVMPRAAHAQGATDRGAFIVVNGNDTVIVERFVRTADSLRASLSMKNQPRVDYTATLGPGNTVLTLLVRIMKPDAAPGTPPLQEVFTAMQGDSAIISMGASTMRVGTTAGAVPSIANAFALFESFTRRARLTGGVGDYAYFAMAGARTLPLTVRPVGADTLVVTVAGQSHHLRVDGAGRILGGIIAGQPAVITRIDERDAAKLTLGTVAAKPAEKPDYSAPRGAPYTAEEVKVHTTAGFDLGGTLTKPMNMSGRLPAVVTITGSGIQDRDEMIPFAGGIRLFRELADTLSRRGIVVLRLDDRGLGASGGDATTATTADFADDIRAAVAYLRSRPDVDPNRIALAGHSEGGVIAPMIAATDLKIHAIVILAGTSQPGIEISMGQNKYIVDHNPSLSQQQRDSILAAARVTLGQQTIPWLKFFLAYDPAVALKKVRVPTLYIQGETDHQVPPAQAEMGAKLIRSNGNKDVSVRLFPATDHLFVPDSTGDITKYDQLKSNKIRPEILGAIADWLVLKLGHS